MPNAYDTSSQGANCRATAEPNGELRPMIKCKPRLLLEFLYRIYSAPTCIDTGFSLGRIHWASIVTSVGWEMALQYLPMHRSSSRLGPRGLFSFNCHFVGHRTRCTQYQAYTIPNYGQQSSSETLQLARPRHCDVLLYMSLGSH